MKPSRHSQPVTDPKMRRRMIISATVFTVVGSLVFGIGLGFIMLVPMMLEGKGALHAFLFPLTFWGYGAVVWIPALLLAWPIANLALRSGSAGLLSALGWGVLLGALIFPIPISFISGGGLFMGITMGSALGAIFSCLYWVGGYRANRSAFK